MIVVGVAGYKGAGKDVVATRLVERWGFVRVGFADALKREVATTLRRTLLAYATSIEDVVPETPAAEEATIRWLLTSKPPVIRALLQEWGTELRRAESPTYWLYQWLDEVSRHAGADRVWAVPWARQASGLRIVVPDVRFENEASFIQEYGGALWLVRRPGLAPDGHESEALPSSTRSWDVLLDNSWSLATLIDMVDEVATRWLEPAIA